MKYKWERREKKNKAKKNRMPKHGRSLLTLELVILDRKENKKTKKKR